MSDSKTDDKKQRLSIQYPVGVCQEPEGEPDVETTLVIRDASGRDLDVEEIADALNNARETNSLLVGSPLSARGHKPPELPTMPGELQERIRWHQTQAALLTQELLGDPMKAVSPYVGEKK